MYKVSIENKNILKALKTFFSSDNNYDEQKGLIKKLDNNYIIIYESDFIFENSQCIIMELMEQSLKSLIVPLMTSKKKKFEIDV